MTTTNNSTNKRFPSGILIGASNETMTDYLTGASFSPTVSGSTSAGTATYTLQFGIYSQVGNILFVTAEIIWTAHTGTGNLLITNLPFNARNLANYNPEGIVNTVSIPLPGSANRTSIGSIQNGTNVVNVEVSQNNAANSPVALSVTGEVHLNIIYLL